MFFILKIRYAIDDVLVCKKKVFASLNVLFFVVEIALDLLDNVVIVITIEPLVLDI